VAVVAIAAVSHYTRPSDSPLPTTTVPAPQPIAPTVQKAFTLDRLLAMTPEELKDVDIGEMNLLCATGLAGAENLDIGHAMSTLDSWAARVTFETNRHLYRVTDPRYADHYHHSEAYLRAEMLVQTLCEDLGVKYDLAAKDDFSFKDSRVAFIHGMIPMPGQTLADTPGGTCASMPVLYVAVGRRLGYPLKLATTKGHVFVRWDGVDNPNAAWRERFNMEGTHGFSSFPDDDYKTWPFKLTDAEVQVQGYLKSLSPAEELAEFLASRGHCGVDNGQMTFAARCFENPCGYDPVRPCYRVWFMDAATKCGYQPRIPALVAMLAQRGPRGTLTDVERQIMVQQEAARREWMRTHPSLMPTGDSPQPSPGVPQPLPPGVPQPLLPKPDLPTRP
jgi:hypothetical protein